MNDLPNNVKGVKKILGLESHSLTHPMWQDVMVLNGLAYITVWIDNLPAWSGIADMEDYRMKRLNETYPDAEISVTPLEAGVHY